MSDTHPRSDTEQPERQESVAAGAASAPKKRLSMHEDVPVWYDCCSCEAEPYWVEQLGEPPGQAEENQSGTGSSS